MIDPLDAKVLRGRVEDEMLNIKEFGAQGDGKTDDTAAIQKAIDAAAEIEGTVLVPEGTFLSGRLKLHPHVSLLSHPTWSYKRSAGPTIRLTDPGAGCLLDLTGAFGATLNGLCLDGGKLGECVHGLLVDKPDYGKEEDTIRIERCRINRFTGDGMRLVRIWVFSVRGCMISHNGGNGIRVRGWDGWVLDNWLSGNGRAGYGAYEENAAVTMTANRIEWNRTGGIVIHGGNKYIITGCSIDCSGGPGISLLPREDVPCRQFTVTGNLIFRSGRPDWRPLDEHEKCHARLEHANGLVFSGNTMSIWRRDGGRGEWSPDYGIVLRSLRSSVVKDNVMWRGALKQLVVDLGGHEAETVVVKDNVGVLGDPDNDPLVVWATHENDASRAQKIMARYEGEDRARRMPSGSRTG